MTARTSAIEGAGLRKTYGAHALFPRADQGSRHETFADGSTGDKERTERGARPIQHFTVHHDGVAFRCPVVDRDDP
ncbi:hypothetical protein [Streptomyces sp. NPDC005953]|uniref:hypothetical protein n=1 Tax=Streptomyces sp. NPDC005953 TaxID=3156719 RepID=UPI0034014CED